MYFGHRWYQVLLPWRHLNLLFLFPYSCDLVNCRWEANSEIIGLCALLRNLAPLNCSMSSLITGSQVLRSATFVFFVHWDKEEYVCCLQFPGVGEEGREKGDRQENNPKMSHSFPKQESKRSLLRADCSLWMFWTLGQGDKGWVIQGLSVAAWLLPLGDSSTKVSHPKKPF